ncbi:hypothetical protein DRE_06060 [Drechslerella stenobrocha 248]|uniref:Extracellular membrane protein CFEM domain-containing protein n=1 Tax=Drechslerella stenobrocha 248 TaxID=1043628 RepID=W7HYD9_9PEZI|nr:hypothetical protein DRE_06060 [Drechslerella stenobrocha 248]
MKVAVTVLTAVIGLVASAAAETITAPPGRATAPAMDPAQASTLSCIVGCGAGNVNCQAQCQGLPTPDEGSVNATFDCIAGCPAGGTEAQNAAAAACQQRCVASYYYTQSLTVVLPVNTAAPGAGATSNGNGATGVRTSGGPRPAATGSDSNDNDESSDPSQTGERGGANPTGSRNTTGDSTNAGIQASSFSMPLVGAVALFLGALAL